MNLIYNLLKKSWCTITVAAFLGVSNGFCQTILLAVINNAIRGQQENLSRLFLNFTLLASLIFLTGFLAEYLTLKLSLFIEQKLQLRLSRLIINSSLRHVEELGSSQLLVTLTEDIEVISRTISTMPTLLGNFAIVVGCFIYLGWLSRSMLLGTISCISLSMAIIYFLQLKATKKFSIAREQRSVVFKRFGTIINGIKELKLHSSRRESFLGNELQSATTIARDLHIAGYGIWTLISNLYKLILFFILGILLFYLPSLAQVNPSIVSAYILAFVFLLQPLASILNAIQDLNLFYIALQKINIISQSLENSLEKADMGEFSTKPLFNKIEIKGITHTYSQANQDDNFTFGPVDLTFYPGEIIFIVGGNGSGKSTFAKLISGLYIPESGKIYLNSELISDRNRKMYRQLFTAIFADFYLFERLLGISQKEIDKHASKYLKLLDLEHKVQIKDGGVLSNINLSQGQRKRLALLTAYLENRPIYLFDEWAADQDPAFKKAFYEQLIVDLKRRGKTILVISHDDRYFHLADKLVKLDRETPLFKK